MIVPQDSNHHHEEHMEGGRLPLWTLKLFAATLVAAVCAAGCLLPVVLAIHAQKSRPQQQQQTGNQQSAMQSLLSLVNCYAAGAFLGLAMIHLLPEAVQQLQREGYLLMLTGGHVGKASTFYAYNIAYVLAAVGFTAMLTVEQFLAGGHAHCRPDASLPGAAQGGRATSFYRLSSFVELARWHSAAGAQRPLQHSSHHHAQHHLLCTTANYCPGCDDCAEAATAAPAAGGEASSATSAAIRDRQRGADDDDSDASAERLTQGLLGQQNGCCGERVGTEKERVLQLSGDVSEQIPGDEQGGLYRDQDSRTHSRETANTSTGCGDSLREKSSTSLLQSQKTYAAADVKSEKRQLHEKEEELVVVRVQHVSQDSDMSSRGSADDFKRLTCTDNESFSAQRMLVEGLLDRKDDAASDTGNATARLKAKRTLLRERAVGTPPGEVALPAALASNASAVAGGKKATGRSAAKKIPQLLLGICALQEAAKIAAGTCLRPRGRTDEKDTTTRKSRSTSSNGDKRNRQGKGKHHRNTSSEPCCRSTSQFRDIRNPSGPSAEEAKRPGRRTSAAATPGDTGDARSAAAAQGKCGCKHLEGAVMGTPCCCSGCCKKCGDHSHDPESSSRVHSGSMGAGVQGGDGAVEQQRGALAGSCLRAVGIRRFADGRGAEEGMDGRCSDSGKEEAEIHFAAAQVSASETILTVDPVSPRAKSLPCYGCCSSGETGGTLESRLLTKHDSPLQQQRLLENQQHQNLKAGHSLAERGLSNNGGAETHNSAHGALSRFWSWIGHFDAAKWSLTAALGVHAIFEGLILGTTTKREDIWIAALAIVGHKGAEGVAVSSTLLHLGLTKFHVALVLGLFVLASPVGVFLGAVAAKGGTGVCGIFNALAVGAVLYATNEMLAEFAGRCSRTRRVLKLLAFIVGLGLLFGLDLLHTPFCHQHGAGNRRHSSHV